MDHIQLVKDALVAIDRVNADASVDEDVTRASLEEIRDEVEVMLDVLGN